MTKLELEAMVARHEMQRLEFKESCDAEAIESACAFANSGGGFILIGVNDAGQLSEKPLRFEALRDYENKIATATEPRVSVDAEKVPFLDGEIVLLKVAKNPLKPVAVKGRSFIRKGSVNHQMTPSEIAECHLKSTGSSMDSVTVPGVTKDDLDMSAVRRYMQKATIEGRRAFTAVDDPWTILKKLRWVKSETEITQAAYLLFAKDPQEMCPTWKNGNSQFVTTYLPRTEESFGTINDPINHSDDPINDPINGTINFVKVVESVIGSVPGINRESIATKTGKSVETVKRAIAKLTEDKRIAHRGSKKTGGYFPYDAAIDGKESAQ